MSTRLPAKAEEKKEEEERIAEEGASGREGRQSSAAIHEGVLSV